MRREIIYRSVAVLAIASGGIVGAEQVARWLHPESTRSAILARIERERYHWRRPDADLHHVGTGVYGMRFPEGETIGQPRIMIVGDSFAMGHGVEPGDRFGALLQQSLGNSARVDVLATSSYSPVIYRKIVDRALSAAPYAVVAVFVDQTDPADDLIYRHDLLPDDDFDRFDVALMAERDRIVQQSYDRIEDRFRGWNGLWRRSSVVNLLVPPPTILEEYPRDDRHFPYVELSLARWELIHLFNSEPGHEATISMERRVMRHLDEIVERCGGASVPLLFAANPWRNQVTGQAQGDRSDSPPVPNRLEGVLVSRYGDRPGVDVIRLTDSFLGHPDPESLYLTGGEIHWSRKGHAEVERNLRESLRPLLSSRN